MTGCDDKPVHWKMPLEIDYTGKKSNRERFFPVRITGQGTIIPVEFHGSAHIQSFAEAEGIANILSEQNIVRKGSIIDVRPI